MNAGFPPFFCQSDDITMTINKIKSGKPPLELINSGPLRDLLSLLLEKNPKKRLGFNKSDEIKKHPWFQGVHWDRILRREEKAPFVPTLTTDEDISFFIEDSTPS